MTWTIKFIGGELDGKGGEYGNCADFHKGDTMPFDVNGEWKDVDMSRYKLFTRYENGTPRRPAEDDGEQLEGIFYWVKEGE